MGRKKKALLAEQGIVHLKHSFVQPTEESGLLKTVGGGVDRSALILSTGTYGYAIPLSSLNKEGEGEERDDDSDSLPEVVEVVESTSDPEIKIVREVPPGSENSSSVGSSSSTSASTSRSRSSKSSSSKHKSKSKSKDKSEKKRKGQTESEGDKEDKEKEDVNHDERSVAELVRVIGGGFEAPLRRCDVVDDRKKESNGEEDKEEMDTSENVELEDDPEADAFYESLGIQRNKRRKLDDGEEEAEGSVAVPMQVACEDNSLGDDGAIKIVQEDDPDVMQSISDYYKDNASKLYYYSQQHDPYGPQRLEFGSYIDAEDSSEYDQDYIQLARLAQRARAAAQAAAEKRKRETQSEPQANEEVIYDPLPMEVVTSTKPEELGITVDTNLEQYWDFVKEDPHAFDRWIYLIQYAEHSDNLNTCRSVYSAFLPLFPYCFGYWKRYSELEKKFYYHGRALAILEKGLEFIPLSVDLWLSYIGLFKEINVHQPDFEMMVRKEFQRALNTCGMEFRSDPLWEAFIEWETGSKRLRRVFSLYRRLIQVPTRLYNRHWDDVQALVRDHHPRVFLEYDEYESMRKKGCKKFGFRYKAEPEVEPGELRKTSKPEDKLMDYTKSKILKHLTAFHVKCEEEVNKRWLFEDKIRRPYYHTKPLDKFQLRNWEEYLNFEMQENNYDRTVLLFERCVIACANYEEFWAKYARYVEKYHKEHSKDMNVSVHVQKCKINEELVSQKETEKEEAIVADVKEILEGLIDKVVAVEEEEASVRSVVDTLIDKVLFLEENDNFVFNRFSTIAVNELLNEKLKVGLTVESPDGKSQRPPHLSGNSELPHRCGDNDNINISNSSAELTSLISVPTFPQACFRWQETVRDIYRRACIIHCPKKPIIRLQWAAYEEELGNLDESRKLIQHVLQWFPTFLDAKLQLIDLERRAGSWKTLEELYEKYLSVAKSPSEYSLLASKYSRYLFKEKGKADKALTVLRKAIRKDKGNASLYSRVFDICYERYPTDQRGAAASLELAILNKDLSDENKLIFLRRKMLFFQEHGDIRRVRDTVEQLREAEEKMQKVRVEQQRIKEEEEKEVAFLRSEAYKKLEILQKQNLQAYPVPDISSAAEAMDTSGQNPVPIDFETNQAEPPPDPMRGPIRAQIITEGSSVKEALQEGPELPYQKVPPPRDCIVDSSTYGYGSKHPDQKIMEHMAQKEYEKLESKGYPEMIKDTDEDRKYLRQQAKIKHSTKDPTYIVAPRESYSVVPVGPPPRRRLDPPAPGELELQPPRAMAILPIPSTAPCVNVPEWFIKEGGELCLSESSVGFSIMRYWPHFLTEEGNEKMFRSVRRHVKWHQKQKIIAGHWRYLHRLVSWLGPCDFTHNGMVMAKCEDWPPEILDQLHRLNQMVNHEFNACSLDLYRHGHDWNSWHSDNLPAYGSNPPVAIVTLGSIRILELKRKGREFNYIRMPLFPGSLLLMEGVMQSDWAHQITKDPQIRDETLTLTFRIMHAIEMPDSSNMMKLMKGNASREKDVKGKDKQEEEEEISIIGFGPKRSSPSSKPANAEATATATIEEKKDSSMDKVKSSDSKSSKDKEKAKVKSREPDTHRRSGDKEEKSTKIVYHKIR